MVNYQNGLVYKLECKNLETTDLYVGSTCNFNRRKQKHKSACTNENGRDYNYPVYQYIRQHGGWSNWQMILVEEVPCQNKKQLNRTEAKYIKDLGAVLNYSIPCRTVKEYYEDNKEVISKKAKEYYEDNREVIAKKAKEYYEDNREVISKKAKEYYEDNNQIIKEKSKEYREKNNQIIKEKDKKKYEKNKDIINEKRKQKIECPCGSVIRKDCLARHKKSIKHQQWEKKQEQQN